MGGTQHIGVGRVGFFNRHFVVEAVGNQKFAHFVTAAEFVDKLLIEPRFVDFQRRIGQQAVAVETLNVVAFVGAAVAPDIHIVFFHGGNEHGAGHGAAQRRGVEVGDAAGGNGGTRRIGWRQCLRVPTARGSQSGGHFLRRIHRFFRNGVVIVFVRLAEVGGVGVRQCAFEFHPQQCGRGIKTAGEGDADFLTDGEIL